MKVAGRPFLDHQLALVRAWGVRRVVVCAGHLGGQIEDHLRGRAAAGLEVECVHDGPRLLGTAGALRRRRSGSVRSFWVLYGDSYLDRRARPRGPARGPRRRPGAKACYGVRPRNRGAATCSTMTGAWSRTTRSAGARICVTSTGASPCSARARSSAFPWARGKTSADLFALLARRGLLAAHAVSQRFFEIGSPAGLAETRLRLEGR